MPGDVVSGQKIGGNLSAGDWNRMRAHSARTEPPKGFGVSGGSDESVGDGIALVKNSSSETFAPGEVVGLESPEFTSSDDENTIRNNLYFKGAKPTGDHTGKFGVVLNGLAADGTSPAQIHGLCWAKLNMTAEGDAFADVEADTKILKSGSSGAAQILYAFPKGTEYPQETVGYVRVGNKPSGGGGGYVYAETNSATDLLTTHTSAAPLIIKPSLSFSQFQDSSLPVYHDASDNYFKVTEAGDYVIWFNFLAGCNTVVTADAQEIVGWLTKQTGSGGGRTTILLAHGTLFNSGATRLMGQSPSMHRVVSLVAGDWLTTTFHNQTDLGTKIDCSVGYVKVLISKATAIAASEPEEE